MSELTVTGNPCRWERGRSAQQREALGVCVCMVNKTDSNSLPQVLGGRARNRFIKKSGRRMRTP